MHWLRCGIAALSMEVAFGAPVLAQSTAPDVPDEVANVPTDQGIPELLVPATTAIAPPNVPGAKQGPKTSEPEVEVPAKGREWFGELAPWEWARLTGDWAGARTWLEEHGITIESSFTLEWANAISGGVGSKWVRRNYFDFNTTFDFDKLFEWKGGTFYVDFASSDTQDNGIFVPVAQLTSNIDIAGDTYQVANLWFEQKLFDDMLRLKFGKIDTSFEFGYLDATEGFLNLSACVPPAVSTIPWYPYSGLGGLAYLYPCEHFYVGAGAFDAQGIVDRFVQENPFDEVWTVGETGITWKEFGPIHDGRVSLGGWWDSERFDRFDGNGQDTQWGLYALAQQRLWRPEGATDDDDRGLWIFGQFSYANPDVSAIESSYAGGIALHGTFPGRDDDRVGVYVSNARFANASGLSGSETVVELFYGVQVTPAIMFTPDIQFVTNPGGTGGHEAIVLTLRLEMSF